MRRTVSYALVIIGLFLIFLSPLLRLYSYPRVHKAPLDQYTRAVSIGTGTYFSTRTLTDLGPVKLQNTKVVRGNVHAGTSTTAAYDYTSSTQDLSHGGRPINVASERYTFDRVTGESVHCCGENPRHDGLTLKFPFDTQKKTYLFWDMAQDISPGLTQPYPATFSGTSTIDGLQLYVFKEHVPETVVGSLEVSGATAGTPGVAKVTANFTYTADSVYYVEPVTGVIVNGTQHAIRLLKSPAGTVIFTVADTNLGYDAATIKDQVDLSKKSKSQLRVVSFFLPVVGPIIGLVFIVIGLIISAGSRPKTEQTDEKKAKKAKTPPEPATSTT